MQPIINPWFFYFIDLLRSLNTLFIVTAVLSGSIVAIIVFSSFVDFSEDEDSPLNSKFFECKVAEKVAKIGSIICIISIIMCVVLPSQQTAYKMLVASFVTEDNVAAVRENTVQFITDVVKALEEKRK